MINIWNLNWKYKCDVLLLLVFFFYMFYFHFCLFAYHVDSFTACAYAFITMCDMACGGAADELHRTELHVENDTTVWSSVLQCGVQTKCQYMITWM